MRPFVSVIIPHYNDVENLYRCIDCLEKQTWPRDRFEIIVADNNSIGGVAALAPLVPRIRAVAAPEQGAGPARNVAVAAAQGSVLAFIDSDCFAEPQWLEDGVAGLEKFDYVGGEVKVIVPKDRPLTPAEGFDIVFGFEFKKYIEQEKFSGSGNLFVPREIFDKVGGFQKDVSEDKEWCHRANALGYRIGYVPNALVWHPARRAWRELIRKWDRVTAESRSLASRRKGWQAAWLCRAALVTCSTIPHSVRIVRSPLLVGAQAKAAGVIGLFGIRLYRAFRMVEVAIRDDTALR
jgi:GT2 family glycosyltransferase